MLNSTEHEISTTHKKTKMLKNKHFLLSNSQMLYLSCQYMLKMLTDVGNLTVMSTINFMLSSVEHKDFIPLGPDHSACLKRMPRTSTKQSLTPKALNAAGKTHFTT